MFDSGSILHCMFYIDIKIQNNILPKAELLFRNSQMLNYPTYAMYSKDLNVLIAITIHV
jgi:hypothetical protein